MLSKYRNNRIEAVLWYINHDNKSSAEKLVERYISDWSKGDLIVIVRHKLHTKGLLEEADRQHALLDLVEEFLSKQSYNLDHAVEASDIALSSLNKAEENKDKLLKIWENRNDRRIVSLFSQKQAKPPGPKIILLLNLFSDPRSTSKQPTVSKYCMRFFGRNIVEAAVSRSVPKANERFSVLYKFDANAFQHLRPSQGKTSQKEERGEFFIGDNVTIYGLQVSLHNSMLT